MNKSIAYSLRSKIESPMEDQEAILPSTLDKMIAGAIRKNRLDQKALYEKYYNLIFSICLRYTGNRSEAESTVNLCFLKILDQLEKYDATGSFEGWICRLSVNVCIDHIRARARYQKRNLPIEDNLNAAVDSQIINELALQDLYKIIQELPDTHRIVFSLHVIEGYKHKEIAEMLNINTATSRWYLAKAKEQLKNKINRQNQ